MNIFSNPIALRSMTEKVEIDNKQNQVRKNDVFFTTSSETPNEVGMSSVWMFEAENMYLNSFCFGWRPSANVFNSYFLAFLLRNNSLRKRLNILAQGISRYNISKNSLMKEQIKYPKISEQEKIGKILRNIDQLIASNQRNQKVVKIYNSS